MRHLLRLAFDGVFIPLAKISPFCALVLFSMASGLLVSVIFRFAGNREALRSAKDTMQAGLLGVRLFQDQLEVSLGCYVALFGGAVRYMGNALIPAAIGVIPLSIIFCQLEMRMEWSPAHVGDTFLMTARARDAGIVESLSLQLPEGLTITAPPVRLLERGEITWRIRADKNGFYAARIMAPNGGVTKTIVVGEDLSLLSPVRNLSFIHSLLYFDESRLPTGGPLEQIDVHYESRPLEWTWLHLGWAELYFVLTFIAALAFKPLTGAEI